MAAGAKELAARVWNGVQTDDVLGHAAQLSYYFLVSLFPLLLLLLTILGYLAGPGSDIRRALLDGLYRVMPGDAGALVGGIVEEISRGANATKLSVGVVATLWAASSGMSAVIDGLNAAYEVKETRPWWRTRLIATALTVALAVLSICAMALLLFGTHIGNWLSARFGWTALWNVFWNVLRWPLVFGFVVAASAVIYRYAPNVPSQSWPRLLPGTGTAVLLWLAASFGLRVYLQFFNSYSRIYGSLGTAIILLLWLYVSGVALLIGGELNSEIEKARTTRP